MNAQKRMRVPFLRSIRGKMATSFTLVIVFIIIMVLGFVAIILVVGDGSRLGTTGYVNDVVSALRIQSYYYQDANGYSPERLQEMIEYISQQGYLVMPSGSWINTDKARLVHGTEFLSLTKTKWLWPVPRKRRVISLVKLTSHLRITSTKNQTSIFA